MTAACGGTTSSAKPSSPGAVFLSGEAAVAMAAKYLKLPGAFLDALAYAAGQSISLSTFCASDPPAMPTFDPGDLIDIATSNAVANPTAFAKLAALIQIAAWYAFCQCDGKPDPTPPAPPTYPSGGIVINPTGYGDLGTPECWKSTLHFATPYADTTGIRFFPLTPRAPLGNELFSDMFPGHHINWTVAPNADGTVNGNWAARVNYYDSGGLPLGAEQGPYVTPGTQNTWHPPNESTINWYHLEASLQPDPGNPPGVDNSIDSTFQVLCNQALGTIQPCCPPDPRLQATLDQLLQLVTDIYASSNNVAHSFAEATVHSGLSGNGQVVLVDAAIAVKVSITTDRGDLRVLTGDPSYLFDRGYIVPIVNEGPIREVVRLTYNPQVYMIPPLTETIGYSLTSGIIITITELVRGP